MEPNYHKIQLVSISNDIAYSNFVIVLPTLCCFVLNNILNYTHINLVPHNLLYIAIGSPFRLKWKQFKLVW